MPRKHPGRNIMAHGREYWSVNRRTLLKPTAALAAVQVASPFIIQARGETPIKIGMVDPLTGVYAAIAQGEVVGSKYAGEQITSKGGILGRPVELLIEDSANDVGTGVAEDTQIDRARPSEFCDRRREFRHRNRHGSSDST